MTTAPASSASNLFSAPSVQSPASTEPQTSKPSLFGGFTANASTSGEKSKNALASAPALGSGLGEQSKTSESAAQQSTTGAGKTGTNDASKPSNLGQSTSGPRPPAQSRLKNKSMDEIITRWAADLSKYQKEFQRQAMKVAEWDRMLVENSDKIQKLYGSTLEAERATAEVERQLTAVENDQNELESWLDRYEKQLDDLIAQQVGQGDALQGPDQERERTYVSALVVSLECMLIYTQVQAHRAVI
jgi:nuclear pore complex protein Nup62